MNSNLSRHSSVEEETPAIVTQICSLRFQDGQIAAARIEAPSLYQACPVAYSGAVDRLPIRDGMADTVLLRVLFQSFARELGAKFEEKLTGSWERCTQEDGANTP